MRFVVLGDIGRRNLYHVGDEAMTAVAIEMLSARGASRITLVATDPDEATRLYDLPAVPRVGFTAKHTRAAMTSRLGAITEEPDLVPELSAAVEGCDAVLIAGGGNMTSLFVHHIYERLVLARLARHYGKPLLITSQTVGPVLHSHDQRLIAEILEYATIFGARDPVTYALARELAPAANVWRTSDDAALLTFGAQDAEWARGHRRDGERFIVGSFTSDPGSSGLDRHTYLDLVTGSLDALARDYDAEVLLIPHAGTLDGPARKLDELSDAAIAERSRSGRIRPIPTSTARQTLALMDGALLSVSTRYHPVVFAPLREIPALGISLSVYSTARMRGALGSLGMAGAVVPATAWHTVDDGARELLERRDALTSTLRSACRDRAADQERWWDALVSSASAPAPAAVPFAEIEQFRFDGDWVGQAGAALATLDELDTLRTRAEWHKRELDGLKSRNSRLRQELDAVRKEARALESRLQQERSRKVVKIADRAGALLRRRSEPSSQNIEPPAAPPPPALSVIVPIYNVERYLAECLSSIAGQTLVDLEIILIDDGSTDGSAAIAEGFAQRDPRFVLLRQENRGLGATRNRGAALARGEYLTFVDSDDVLPKGALESLVGSLRESGSDLALGAVTRIRPDGSTFTPGWVRDLHAHSRTVTLAAEPEILRNFYTWNKAFRRSFWHAHGFVFREGVLFEDQPVITEAFHRAHAIDIVAESVYLWRIRADDSSLTGKMFSVRDIGARREATALTARALAALDVAPHVRQTWLWTLAEFHFPSYIRNTVDQGEDAYRAAITMVTEFLDAPTLAGLPQVTAAKKALLYTALTAPREAVSALVAEGYNTADFQLDSDGGEPALLRSAHLAGDAPLWARRVSEADQRLIAVLDTHSWDAAGALTLTGRVGLSNLLPETSATLELSLVAGEESIALPAGVRAGSTDDRPRPYGLAHWSHFTATIDVPELLSRHPALLTGGVHLQTHFTVDGATHTGILNRFPGVASLHGATLPIPGQTAMLSWSRLHGLGLRTHQREITATEVRVDGGALHLKITSHSDHLDPVFLIAKAPHHPERRAILTREAPGSYRGSIDLSWLREAEAARISVLDDNGRRRNVHATAPEAPEDDLAPKTTPGAGLRVARIS